jgi:hypothetical protein
VPFGDRRNEVLALRNYPIKVSALYLAPTVPLIMSIVFLFSSLSSDDRGLRAVGMILGLIVSAALVAIIVATLRRMPQLVVGSGGVALQLPLRTRALQWQDIAAIESDVDGPNKRLRVRPYEGQSLDIPAYWLRDAEKCFAELQTAFESLKPVAEQTHAASRDT